MRQTTCPEGETMYFSEQSWDFECKPTPKQQEQNMTIEQKYEAAMRLLELHVDAMALVVTCPFKLQAIAAELRALVNNDPLKADMNVLLEKDLIERADKELAIKIAKQNGEFPAND